MITFVFKNYTFHGKIRKQKYLRKSGGLGVFINERLSKRIELRLCIWVKLCKSLNGLRGDVILGAVYLHSPLHSRFYNDDEYSIFELEITEMSSKYEHIFMTGDWNSQTACLTDYYDTRDWNEFLHIDLMVSRIMTKYM